MPLRYGQRGGHGSERLQVTLVALVRAIPIVDAIFAVDSLAPQVSENDAGGVMARHAGDAASRVRGGAALI